MSRQTLAHAGACGMRSISTFCQRTTCQNAAFSGPFRPWLTSRAWGATANWWGKFNDLSSKVFILKSLANANFLKRRTTAAVFFTTFAGNDSVIVRADHGGVQLHPRSGRHLLRHCQRPPAEHLGLLRTRPHLRLQLWFHSGQLSNSRWESLFASDCSEFICCFDFYCGGIKLSRDATTTARI